MQIIAPILFPLGAKKEADRICFAIFFYLAAASQGFFLAKKKKKKGRSRGFWEEGGVASNLNTSPFLGFHARTRDAPHQEVPIGD